MGSAFGRSMEVKPVLPNEQIKAALQPSLDMGNFSWAEIEKAFAEKAACFWQIGSDAWVVTYANIENEIEILLCGGRDALRCAEPFEKHMLSRPAHKGMTLRIEGRKAWKRMFKTWDCVEKDGSVLLTKVL